MAKSFQIIVAVITGIAAFVFFSLLYFPLDAVVGHMLANLENDTKGRYRVSYANLDPSLIFDSTFEDFRLEQKTGDAYEEVIFAQHLKIGLSLIVLVSGTVDTRFEASLKHGSVAGRAVFSGDKSVLDLKLAGVRLQQIGILASALKSKDFSARLNGKIDGTALVTLGRTVADTEADLDMKFTGLTLKDVNISMQGAKFPVPDLVLAPEDNFARVEGTLDSGRLNIATLEVPGPDVELQLKGRLNFGDNFGLTRINVRGRFALSDMVFEKIPLLSVIKEHKTADGFFPLALSGDPKKPQIRIGNFNLGQMLNF